MSRMSNSRMPRMPRMPSMSNSRMSSMYDDMSESKKYEFNPITIIGVIIGLGLISYLIYYLLSSSKSKPYSTSPASTQSPTPMVTTMPPMATTMPPMATTMPPMATTMPPNMDMNSTNALVFYTANGDILPEDHPCYRCASKANPCACYVNNKCSMDMSLPQAMRQACNMQMNSQCLRYEKQDENGNPARCTDEGLNMFKQLIASQTQRADSYLCKTSENKVTNCQRQCKQGDYPFTGMPNCSACCEQACQTISCPTLVPDGVRPTYAPPPSTNVPACAECSTICRLNSPYTISCEECNKGCE